MEDDDVVVLIERDRCCAAVLSGGKRGETVGLEEFIIPSRMPTCRRLFDAIYFRPSVVCR